METVAYVSRAEFWAEYARWNAVIARSVFLEERVKA